MPLFSLKPKPSENSQPNAPPPEVEPQTAIPESDGTAKASISEDAEATVSGDAEAISDNVADLTVGTGDTDEPAERTVLDSLGHQPGEGTLDPNDSRANVEVLQNDPSTPYYSAKSFEELGLSEALLNGIYAMGFNKPSKIQEHSLPIVLGEKPRNLVAQAHNGSGKTACFSLAMLHHCDFSQNHPQALCVCPARELALQIENVVLTMGKFTGAKTFLAVKQGRTADRSNEPITAQIVIGTPGRVFDLFRRRRLAPDGLKIFVLDEADFMLEQQGLGDQSVKIKNMLPPNCQKLLFSATWKDRVRDFAEKVASPADIITVKKEDLSLDGVKQFFVVCKSEQQKIETLDDLYGLVALGQSIIFTQRRQTASDLAQHLQKQFSVSLLHGDMEPELRDKVIGEFRSGATRIMITTNVLARGIDILQVSLVINFDIPVDRNGEPDPETYLHRIGRSGRFGRKGIAINLVHDEGSVKALLTIQRHFDKNLEELAPEEIETLGKYLK